MANPPGPLFVTIGKNIASLRRQHGLTQAQFSEQLGMEPASLSRIERGLSGPSLATLAKMAEILSCPLAVLLSTSSGSDADEGHLIGEMLRSLSNDQKRFLLNQLQTWVQFLRNGTEPDQASPGNFKP